jgi:hypothetical protein
VTAPPVLRWVPVQNATYYNVQLSRGASDTRVYSAWPQRAQLRLPAKWTYQRRPMSLEPGPYCWRVWPGFGRLSEGAYGRLLGASYFIVED